MSVVRPYTARISSNSNSRWFPDSLDTITRDRRGESMKRDLLLAKKVNIDVVLDLKKH